jgi:hypothetical protein
MPDAIGVLSKLGLKDVAGWTTAYAAVDEVSPFVSETLSQAFTRLEDVSLVGTAGRAVSKQGVQALAGQTVHLLDYNNFDTIFEAAFGNKSTRTFTFTDRLAKYLWLEIDKQNSRWRFGAAKIGKIVISGEKDDYVRLTVDWVGRDIDRNATAFPGISTPGARNLVRFEDLQARFETIASGAPGSSDEKRLESFELEIDNVLVEDDYASKSATASEEKWPLEPIRNGFRVVKLKIKQPRYDSDADFLTWKDADTPIQADFTFSAGGETFVIDLPDMRITTGGDAPVGGPERVQNEYELDCYYPAAGNPLYTGGEVRAIFT